MIEANWLLLTLDSLESRSEAQVVGLVMRDALRIYADLEQIQKTHHLTDAESIRLQIALDRIGTKLRMLGRDLDR